MPVMTASTSTLMPDETICPRTRSAMKAVRPKKAKGSSTKPARVTNLNSRMVTKTCTARMKKASTTITQAMSRIMICTKLVNRPTGPTKSAEASSRGCAASIPVAATTPGRMKSPIDIAPPLALSPSPAKLSSMMTARVWKLPMMKAKTPM